MDMTFRVGNIVRLLNGWLCSERIEMIFKDFCLSTSMLI